MPEKDVQLLFGEETIDLRVPETVSILDMKRVEPLPDPEGAVYTALADPIQSPPLTELAQGRGNACVVISKCLRGDF
jgi:nickel-dependent lactate racemase